MDLLRNLFGSLTSGIIRLAVMAGVLFLCYLFIVKPVLKTTNDAIKSSGIDQVGRTLQDVGPRLQREIKRSLKMTEKRGNGTQRLIRCIRRADGDARRIQRCVRRF